MSSAPDSAPHTQCQTVTMNDVVNSYSTLGQDKSLQDNLTHSSMDFIRSYLALRNFLGDF